MAVELHSRSQRPVLESFPIMNDGQRGAAVNAFSVDVEDYFQVEAFKTVVNRASWNAQPSRVVDNTMRLLDLLDSAGVKGTFFVLGWVAERFGSLVQEIKGRGHEIASHGYDHERVGELNPREFRDDVRRAKNVLEDCSGARIRGFRAPTFSITADSCWAYDVLIQEGYEYSSSLYPIAHDLYGSPGAPRSPFAPVSGSPFLEIPIATIRVFGANRPCGGGGYFRLMPYRLSRWCIAKVNRNERLSCVFYCHPWEFDAAQPRFSDAPLKSRIRHYLNLRSMEHRVRRLLGDFRWGRIDQIFLPNISDSCKGPV